MPAVTVASFVEHNESAATYRMSPTLKEAFAKRCGDQGIPESAVIRLLMAGFVMGSIDVVASGHVNAPPAKAPAQLSLVPEAKPVKAKRSAGRKGKK